jgi:hypothetical protein
VLTNNVTQQNSVHDFKSPYAVPSTYLGTYTKDMANILSQYDATCYDEAVIIADDYTLNDSTVLPFAVGSINGDGKCVLRAALTSIIYMNTIQQTTSTVTCRQYFNNMRQATDKTLNMFLSSLLSYITNKKEIFVDKFSKLQSNAFSQVDVSDHRPSTIRQYVEDQLINPLTEVINKNKGIEDISLGILYFIAALKKRDIIVIFKGDPEVLGSGYQGTIMRFSCNFIDSSSNNNNRLPATLYHAGEHCSIIIPYIQNKYDSEYITACNKGELVYTSYAKLIEAAFCDTIL